MTMTEPTVAIHWTSKTLPAEETARLLRLLFGPETADAPHPARGEAA